MGEGVVENGLAGGGDEALALLVLGEPVADAALAIAPVNPVESRNACNLTVVNNGGCESLAILNAGLGLSDEVASVV